MLSIRVSFHYNCFNYHIPKHFIVIKQRADVVLRLSCWRYLILFLVSDFVLTLSFWSVRGEGVRTKPAYHVFKVVFKFQHSFVWTYRRNLLGLNKNNLARPTRCRRNFIFLFPFLFFSSYSKQLYLSGSLKYLLVGFYFVCSSISESFQRHKGTMPFLESRKSIQKRREYSIRFPSTKRQL